MKESEVRDEAERRRSRGRSALERVERVDELGVEGLSNCGISVGRGGDEDLG